MKALAMTKLKNQLLSLNPDLLVELRNIRVNGELFGCSGFVTDPKTDRIVYVNTDHNHGLRWNDPLYRTATSTRDYTGGQNHFTTYDKLPGLVVALLRGHNR